MSTSDTIAFWNLMTMIGEFVVLIVQSVLLLIYAIETMKLRKDAAEQNKLIVQQVATSGEQSKLMAEQLKVMADGLTFQRDEIENADKPLFEVRRRHCDGKKCGLILENLKGNVHLTEFRSNNDKTTINDRRTNRMEGQIWFEFTSEIGCVNYLAIFYRTMRGKIGFAVFQYHSGYDKEFAEEVPITFDNTRHWQEIKRG